MPGFQPYTIPAKKPFYHIVMKQISFFVKSGLLLVAFMTFSGYGKAQIKFESGVGTGSAKKLEKFVPITDGTVNMGFPKGKLVPTNKYELELENHRNKYDLSISAQIEFYKAFIGQKILFYGNYLAASGYYTFPYAAKRKIVNLLKPATYTENGITYTVSKVSTRRAYDKATITDLILIPVGGINLV